VTECGPSRWEAAAAVEVFHHQDTQREVADYYYISPPSWPCASHRDYCGLAPGSSVEEIVHCEVATGGRLSSGSQIVGPARNCGWLELVDSVATSADIAGRIPGLAMRSLRRVLRFLEDWGCAFMGVRDVVARSGNI
jgi:hypothetical protein